MNEEGCLVNTQNTYIQLSASSRCQYDHRQSDKAERQSHKIMTACFPHSIGQAFVSGCETFRAEAVLVRTGRVKSCGRSLADEALWTKPYGQSLVDDAL